MYSFILNVRKKPSKIKKPVNIIGLNKIWSITIPVKAFVNLDAVGKVNLVTNAGIYLTYQKW